MKNNIAALFKNLRVTLIDDNQRKTLQFFCVYLILSIVAVFMTIVNVFTQRYVLMMATLLFAVASLINLALSIREGVGRAIASVLFSVEITVLFAFFIISGEPEGFSAIWVCMLPASGLLLFGKKRGCLLCAVEFATMLFFFWLPFGQTLLQYRYTDSFMLRFPMLYVAFFLVAFFLETIRESTYNALQDSKQQYEHLCSHDALTGVYNRYGFNEHMDALLKLPNEQGIALMILDVDNFKNVNDCYGHPAGDTVLKEIAAMLVRECGTGAAVCRWGGEEFAVILPSAEGCEEKAARVLDGVRILSVCVGNETVHITVSIGLVTASPQSNIAPAALVTQTDRCLYMAKDEGKDCIVHMPYRDGVIAEPVRSARQKSKSV